MLNEMKENRKVCVVLNYYSRLYKIVGYLNFGNTIKYLMSREISYRV